MTPKQIVVELVDVAMNGNDLDALDALCTPRLAQRLRQAFLDFRGAFPDWHQEVVELVAEEQTVVARFRCTGTHLGEWQGQPASGRTMSVDEVVFYKFEDGRIARAWALEDTWTRVQQLSGHDTTLGELGSLT